MGHNALYRNTSPLALGRDIFQSLVFDHIRSLVSTEGDVDGVDTAMETGNIYCKPSWNQTWNSGSRAHKVFPLTVYNALGM